MATGSVKAVALITGATTVRGSLHFIQEPNGLVSLSICVLFGKESMVFFLIVSAWNKIYVCEYRINTCDREDFWLISRPSWLSYSCSWWHHQWLQFYWYSLFLYKCLCCRLSWVEAYCFLNSRSGVFCWLAAVYMHDYL